MAPLLFYLFSILLVLERNGKQLIFICIVRNQIGDRAVHGKDITIDVQT